MLNEIVNLYGIIIMKILVIASLFKINGRKLNLKDKEFYICVIIYFFVQLIVNFDSFYNVRPFISFLCLVLLCWKILKKEPIQALLSSIYIYFFMLVFEFLIVFLALIMAKITTTMSLSAILKLIDSNVYYSFSINIVFSVIFYIFCSSKKNSHLYSYLDKYLYRNRLKKSYSIILPIFLFILFSFWVLCFSNSLVIIVSVYFLLFLFTSYIIINSFRISNDYENAKERYTSTHNSLVEYEEMIDKYRINNHENKNQLQMIRNMIKQKDNTVEKYIDNLLDTVYTVNESLLMDVSIIPAGGLRASVYSKLVTMDNNNINHTLCIDHRLRKIDFFDNNSKITLKICNLLSIFIDNAIDEVKLQDDKNINIDIFLEDENTVVFEIVNKFISNFEIDKICDSQYTTKSYGHGYGLTLAKEIIASEHTIINKTLVIDNLFIQKLIINIEQKNDKI